MALVQYYKNTHLEIKESYLVLEYFGVGRAFYMNGIKYFHVDCSVNRYVDSTKEVLIRHYWVELEPFTEDEVTAAEVYSCLKKYFPKSKDCI